MFGFFGRSSKQSQQTDKVPEEENSEQATMSKSSKALRAVLESHQASEVGSTKGNVVEFDSKLDPVSAAHTLWSHNIMGAPVWDEKLQKYLGFFDMRDILSAVIATSKKSKEGEEEEEGKESQSLLQKYNTIMVNELEEKKSSGVLPSAEFTVSYLAARNRFVSCEPDTSLLDLAKRLSARGVHRMPIVNAKGGKCIDIISQSALVKFLAKYVNQEDLEETIDEAGFQYQKDIVSVLDTTSAIDAFEKMDSHRLSGIVVVDEDGAIVGNTSARDIKMAAIDDGRTAMDTDIVSYLAAVRQATLSKKERHPSCHVRMSSTVAHVVNLLVKTGYHRVFVVDDELKPVGVISVADIVKFAVDSGVEKEI